MSSGLHLTLAYRAMHLQLFGVSRPVKDQIRSEIYLFIFFYFFLLSSEIYCKEADGTRKGETSK